MLRTLKQEQPRLFAEPVLDATGIGIALAARPQNRPVREIDQACRAHASRPFKSDSATQKSHRHTRLERLPLNRLIQFFADPIGLSLGKGHALCECRG